MKTNLTVVGIIAVVAAATAAIIKKIKKSTKKYTTIDEEYDDLVPDPAAG